MAKYAHFDHTAAQPAPVLGWFNADARHYPNLPATADLLELTDAQWAARLTGAWAVNNGALVAGAPAVATAHIAAQAKATLSATHDHIMQMLEDGKPVPDAWKVYRATLRAIAAGTTTALTLPSAPAV